MLKQKAWEFKIGLLGKMIARHFSTALHNNPEDVLRRVTRVSDDRLVGYIDFRTLGDDVPIPENWLVHSVLVEHPEGDLVPIVEECMGNVGLDHMPFNCTPDIQRQLGMRIYYPVFDRLMERYV